MTQDKKALSDNNQTTAFAISSGLPIRPIGCIDLKVSRNLRLLSRIYFSMSVSTIPGAIAFILIPDFAYSSAADLVNPKTACLLAI